MSYRGLNEWAMDLLGSHYIDVIEEGTQTFPGYRGATKTFRRKSRVFDGRITVNQIVMGLDGQEYLLFRYNFNDGSYAEEYEQAAVWGDAGPEIFAALRDAAGYVILESLWPVEEEESIAEAPILVAGELLTSAQSRSGVHAPSTAIFKVRA